MRPNSTRFLFSLLSRLTGLAVTVLLIATPSAADPLMRYASGETSIFVLRAEEPVNNARRIMIIAAAPDGRDCITLGGGEAWERLCELLDKGGRTVFSGDVMPLPDSSAIYQGDIENRAGGFVLTARILFTSEGAFLKVALPGGEGGSAVAFTENATDADPAKQRLAQALAQHYNDAASFSLEVGSRGTTSRTASLTVDGADAGACLELAQNSSGLKMACEVSSKTGVKQTYSGELEAKGNAAFGTVATDAGASIQLWISDTRHDYALVAAGPDAGTGFGEQQPGGTVVFNGEVARKDIDHPSPVSPSTDGGNIVTTARRVSVDFLGKLELRSTDTDALFANLSLNAAVRGDQNERECRREMRVQPDVMTHMRSLCERAAKDGPYTISGPLVPMPNRRNAFWGRVTDQFGNDMHLMVVNPKADYAEVALVADTDPEFVGSRYSLVPFDSSLFEEEAQKLPVNLDGTWTVDFGPVAMLDLQSADNDRIVGTMMVPAYSGDGCVERGGNGAIQDLCEIAEKDGQRTYQVDGSRRDGAGRGWDFSTNFPREKGFEVVMGSSVTGVSDLEQDTPYIRFAIAPGGLPEERVWHALRRGSPSPAPPAPPSAISKDPASEPLFDADLGRRPTCNDMEAKLAEILSRTAEFATPDIPDPFDQLRFIVSLTLHDIKEGRYDGPQACAQQYGLLKATLQNKIDAAAVNAGTGGTGTGLGGSGNGSGGSGTAGGAGGTGGSSQPPLVIELVSGTPHLIVAQWVCDGYAGSQFCDAVNAGPSKQFPIDDFASAEGTTWGEIDVNGTAFVVRRTSHGGGIFHFYAEDAAERF